jgi:Concanavalin A-like lectin/glucanases superfamily
MFRPVRSAAVAAVLSLMGAGMALAPATVASAATQLLPNATFDGGTTTGWKATNATLSVVTSGFSGDAAKVMQTGTATSYSMYASPKPATGLAPGAQLQGIGEVLGVPGRSICLMLQEYTSGGSSVQTVKGCVTGTGTWQALPATTLTAKNSGDTVGFRITQTGAKAGDSFQADSLSLTGPSSSPPPTVAGHWPMDETTGTKMADTSANGNTGNIIGPVQLGVPGPPALGTAYGFGGLKSPQTYVDVPWSSTLVAGSANIDISFYLNTTHHDSNLNADYDLVRMGDYPFQEYKVELEPNGQLNCTYHGSNGGGNHAQGGPDLADGSWHYIQCIKTATQVQLWIDGADVKNTTFTIGSVSPPSGSDLIMGAHPGSDWYWGELDDVTVTFG